MGSGMGSRGRGVLADTGGGQSRGSGDGVNTAATRASVTVALSGAQGRWRWGIAEQEAVRSVRNGRARGKASPGGRVPGSLLVRQSVSELMATPEAA